MKQNMEVFLSGEGLIALELYFYKRENGKPCKKCGFIQGTYDKGFENYYCVHFRNKIQMKMKPLMMKALKSDVQDAIKELKEEFVLE